MRSVLLGKFDTIDDHYWPYPLRHLRDENPLASQHVVVAEISKPWGKESIKNLFTALAPLELAEKIISQPDNIGTEVTTNGPHPSSYNVSFDYVPRFSIWAGDIAAEGLEPLVVSWRAGSRTILLPDQGFLMTYGLVPRSQKSERGDLIHWDDLERPHHDVVVSKMVSEYYFDLISEAKVTIDREYLQDYAALRNRALIHVYYAMNTDDLVPEDLRALSGKDISEFKVSGCRVDIRKDHRSGSKLTAQIWGARLLCEPGHSPITEGRWDYGSLTWPGLDSPVTIEGSRKLGLMYVYVDDDVLQHYEEHRDRYSIHPESGSVSYGGQWSVSYCERVSRDLIQLEIKKLYEGCPPDVVRHWNRYAVDPPPGIPRELIKEPNVGTRSKRIVYSFVELGAALSELANKLGIGTLTEDFVGLKRGALNYYGWWTNKNVTPITAHIRKDIGENAFLERCKRLNSLVVEGIKEAKVRQLLLKVGVDSKTVEKLRGLKLLDTLIQYSIICQETGFDIVESQKEIANRLSEKISELKPGEQLSTPIDILFVLYDLRIASAHRAGNLDFLLKRLGTDRASVSAGMGDLLDKMYDSVAMGLDKAATLIRQLL